MLCYRLVEYKSFESEVSPSRLPPVSLTKQGVSQYQALAPFHRATSLPRDTPGCSIVEIHHPVGDRVVDTQWSTTFSPRWHIATHLSSPSEKMHPPEKTRYSSFSLYSHKLNVLGKIFFIFIVSGLGMICNTEYFKIPP